MKNIILLLMVFSISFLARGQNQLGRVTFSSGGQSKDVKPSSFGEPFVSAQSNVTVGSQQNTDYLIPTASSTSINTIIQNLKFEIYPNPARSILNITIAGNHSTAYTTFIYDNLGRRCISKENVIQSTSFDITTLPDGIYLFIAFDNNNQKVYQQNFIKN